MTDTALFFSANEDYNTTAADAVAALISGGCGTCTDAGGLQLNQFGRKICSFENLLLIWGQYTYDLQYTYNL